VATSRWEMAPLHEHPSWLLSRQRIEEYIVFIETVVVEANR